jgi:hypothetical protein
MKSATFMILALTPNRSYPMRHRDRSITTSLLFVSDSNPLSEWLPLAMALGEEPRICKGVTEGTYSNPLY